MLLGNINSKSSVKKVIDHVFSIIEDCNISVGEKIPSEKQLTDKLEVSRSTIREALSALVTLGILKSRPGKGYYVIKSYQVSLYTNELVAELMKDDSFFDLMEARKIVESSIFSLAVKRADENDIKRIEETLNILKKAVEEGSENINDLSTDIHFAISRASNNKILVGLLKQLSPMIVEKVEQMDISPDEDYKLHKKLVDGIKSGKSEKAESVIIEHLEYMEEKFIDNLKNSEK